MLIPNAQVAGDVRGADAFTRKRTNLLGFGRQTLRDRIEID
jgi:hypothetical protein